MTKTSTSNVRVLEDYLVAMETGEYAYILTAFVRVDHIDLFDMLDDDELSRVMVNVACGMRILHIGPRNQTCFVRNITVQERSDEGVTFKVTVGTNVVIQIFHRQREMLDGVLNDEDCCCCLMLIYDKLGAFFSKIIKRVESMRNLSEANIPVENAVDTTVTNRKINKVHLIKGMDWLPEIILV